MTSYQRQQLNPLVPAIREIGMQVFIQVSGIDGLKKPVSEQQQKSILSWNDQVSTKTCIRVILVTK
jgi:hypothetical protein